MRLLTNEPRDIEKAIREPRDEPFRLMPYATTGLPAAASWTAGLVYDLTTLQIKWSNGTVWTGLQPLDADLTAIAALSTTSFGRSHLTLADAAAGRTLWGLGTAAVKNTGTSGDAVPVLNGAATTWAAGAAFGGALTSTVSIGYATGAGGTVTQATSKATGVTLDKICGAVTMHNAALAATTSVTFTLTNSTIAATDTVIVSIKSGATVASYLVQVDSVAAGSCQITLRNYTAGSLGEAVVLNFAVIKAVAA